MPALPHAAALPSPTAQVQATSRMLLTRLVSLLPCLTLAVVFEATNTFDTVAQTINIVQSLVLPFGLIPAIQMTASEKVMVGAGGWVGLGFRGGQGKGIVQWNSREGRKDVTLRRSHYLPHFIRVS